MAPLGIHSNFSGISIKGISTCVPNQSVSNDFFSTKFSQKEIRSIEKITGIKTRRWADSETSSIDLCYAAAKKLIQELNWDPVSFDAIIFISQTPEYTLPASSIVLQNKLKIKSCVTLDINLGCSGYPYGLFVASTLINSGSIRRVLLLVGDTISKVIDKHDKSTSMIFGDAGSATAIESDPKNLSNSYYINGSDGSGFCNLIIPDLKYKEVADRIQFQDRNLKYLFMNGPEVFNFTMASIPNLIFESLEKANCSKEDINFFVFHQANKFIIDLIREKASLDKLKVPTNIENFGNTSSASIPLLLSTEVKKISLERQKIAMFGFGVGYSWSSAIIDVGPIKLIFSSFNDI
jgi:3-oxoacyl-[acyl-carrier-protein] synthase-3